jgi:hypothetical protein
MMDQPPSVDPAANSNSTKHTTNEVLLGWDQYATAAASRQVTDNPSTQDRAPRRFRKKPYSVL